MAGRSARRRRPEREPARRNPPEQRPLRNAGRYVMSNFLQDLRYAFRMLAKSPGFTLVAVLTLALGIGANTAIFSVVNAVLLRPLPYPEPNRLVFLGEWSEQIPEMSISMANFNDWRNQNKVFEGMVAYQNDNVVLTGRGEPERLRLRRITAGFFPTLRVKPLLGRELTPEDDKVGAARVVLLGEGFWERRFGRDPSIIGQQLVLDAEPFTIIGVLPSKLHGSLRQTDIFASLWRLEDQLGVEANRGNHPGIYAYARLKPGVSVLQALGEMKGIAQHLDELHPESNGKDSVTLKPLLDAIVEDVRSPLLVLSFAVGFVLLIACGWNSGIVHGGVDHGGARVCDAEGCAAHGRGVSGLERAFLHARSFACDRDFLWYFPGPASLARGGQRHASGRRPDRHCRQQAHSFEGLPCGRRSRHFPDASGWCRINDQESLAKPTEASTPQTYSPPDLRRRMPNMKRTSSAAPSSLNSWRRFNRFPACNPQDSRLPCWAAGSRLIRLMADRRRSRGSIPPRIWAASRRMRCAPWECACSAVVSSTTTTMKNPSSFASLMKRLLNKNSQTRNHWARGSPTAARRPRESSLIG